MKDNQVPFRDPKSGHEWIGFIMESLGASANLFLHTQIGEQYMNVQGGFALILLLFFSIFFPPADVHGLYCFLGVYAVTGACTRVGILHRRMRGIAIHTRYNGWPRLMRFFPRADEMTIKRFVEPPLVFVVGLILSHFGIDRALGIYFITAAICLFYCNNACAMAMRRRLDDLNDSIIEQRDMAEKLRRMNDNYL